MHSNGRKGNPYDNAITESFYQTLKQELVQGANFETPEQAQKEIFKYYRTLLQYETDALCFGVYLSVAV